MKYYGRDRDIQYKVGFMTLLTIIILFLGYSWLRDWFGSGTTEVSVRFTHAGNIEIGDPVSVYGVKRGRVDDVLITKQGVILTLLVEIDFPLSVDTEFYISDSNLMGSRQVDIIPGSTEKFITSEFVAEGESMGSLASLVPKIDAVINEISSLTELFSREEGLGDNLLESIQALNNIAVRIDSFLEDSEAGLTEAVSNINTLAATTNELFRHNKENIEQVLITADTSMKKFEESLNYIDSLLNDLAPISKAMSTDEGTLKRLISDEELYLKLLKTTEQVDSLLTDIQDNPRRYFKFSIF